MAEAGQVSEPIRFTPVGEKVVERQPQWPSGYLEITERTFVDQYGRQWHSFHSRLVFDPVETPPSDKPADGQPLSES